MVHSPEEGAKSSTGPRGLRLQASDFQGLTPQRHIAGRNVTKADVRFYRRDGRAIAVKDYGARPAWVRHTLGRWLVAREAAAYEAAGGVTGLPTFLGRLGPFALAVEWVDGTTLAARRGQTLPPEVFDRLDALVGALHARGIALGDLHHRDVLVDDAGDVKVVDLATAWIAGPTAGSLRRRVFRRLADLDRLAAARMRARFTGQDEADALAHVDASAVRRWQRGRRAKAAWDRLRGR